MWHHQDRRRPGHVVHRHRGPLAGRDHPRPACWTGPGKVWHRVQNWLAERGEDHPAGCESRWIPSRDIRTPLMTSSKTPQRARYFHIVSSLATLQVVPSRQQGTRRSWTQGRIPLQIRLHASRRLTPRQQERLRNEPSADEAAHISVEVSLPAHLKCAKIFHQATPAQGRRLAAHIERLLACPTPRPPDRGEP